MAEITSGERRAANHELFSEAKKFIPGGVNSPVRSFKSVGGYPVFVSRAGGSRIYGECGGEFIDYCLSWGALILGHAYPKVIEALEEAVKNGTSFGTATKSEIELAKLIAEAVPSIEQVRLTSSGTEAVMSAVRLARAHTGRNKIIKFEGAYHGHADYLLTKAGSGMATLGVPDSLGVPPAFSKHTIVLPFNSITAIKGAIDTYKEDLAAVIVEPVMANCGVILPKPGFLKELREITERHGITLIFDEVITGFRLAYGGAQEYFSVKPDLTCLGKIVGGGLPIGAFGGRKDIMELLSPLGGVYQAGTLSGNPIAVTAGIVTLKVLKEGNLYGLLNNRTNDLCANIERLAGENNISLKVSNIGSIFSIFFTDTDLFKRFFHGLLKEGVYLSPSGFEANFLSTAHTPDDIEKTLTKIDKVFNMLKGEAK